MVLEQNILLFFTINSIDGNQEHIKFVTETFNFVAKLIDRIITLPSGKTSLPRVVRGQCIVL